MTTHDLGSAHGDAYVNEARHNVPKQRVAKTADDGTVNDFVAEAHMRLMSKIRMGRLT